MKQDLRRIETFLQEDKNWDASNEEISSYKALEAQMNNTLQLEEIIWRQKVGPSGCNMEIKIQNSSTRKLSREGKQMQFRNLKMNLDSGGEGIEMWKGCWLVTFQICSLYQHLKT